MKFRNTFSILIVLMLAVIAITHADAADFVGSGFYASANVGLAQIDSSERRYESQLEAQTSGIGSLDLTSASLRKSNAAWWVEAGYMITPYIGIEAGYLHLGELYNRLTGTYVPASGSAESVVAWRSLRSQGPAFGLIFRVPLVDRVDICLRIADYYSRSTLSEGNSLSSGSYTTASQTVNASSLLLGLGAAYQYTEHWSARFDYQRIQDAGHESSIGQYDVDVLSVGVGYTF